jgi:hypothetical protein
MLVCVLVNVMLNVFVSLVTALWVVNVAHMDCRRISRPNGSDKSHNKFYVSTEALVDVANWYRLVAVLTWKGWVDSLAYVHSVLWRTCVVRVSSYRGLTEVTRAIIRLLITVCYVNVVLVVVNLRSRFTVTSEVDFFTMKYYGLCILCFATNSCGLNKLISRPNGSDESDVRTATCLLRLRSWVLLVN